MPLTELDMTVLKTISTLYVATREQVQRVCCADHASGRGTRKRLSRLGKAGYIVKHRVPVALPGTNGAAPVYYPTKKGAEALASYFDDERFLATNTKHPRADRLSHWIACNNTRITVEKAVQHVDQVELVQWINEWETVNKDDAKSDQFCLHTQLVDKPPLSCSPDAGFLIRFQDQQLVYYLEQDRATSSPKQVASRKHRGYAELSRQQGHRKHFPETSVPFFRVLFVTPSESRAKRTQEEMQSRTGKELWLMMNEKALNETNFLTGDLAIDHAGETGPLLMLPKPETSPPLTVEQT